MAFPAYENHTRESEANYGQPSSEWYQNFEDFEFQPQSYSQTSHSALFSDRKTDSYSRHHFGMNRYMDDVDTIPYPPDRSYFYDDEHFHRLQPTHTLAYNQPKNNPFQPHSPVRILNDLEDLDSISSGTRTFSVGNEDPRSPVCLPHPYYAPPRLLADSGDIPSMPMTSPQVTMVGSHFVTLNQVEHVPNATQDEAMSDIDAEGDDDPSILPPSKQVTDWPSTKSEQPPTPELQHESIASPSNDDEVLSDADANDSDYVNTNTRSRRSSKRTPPTSIRSRRSARRPSGDNRASINLEVPQSRAPKSKRATYTKAGARSNNPTNVIRPFFCPLAPYGCAATFSSKNEWKRHVSTQHVKIGIWRCEICQPQPTATGTLGSYNDFNRKDLFMQHLKRMHANELCNSPEYTSLAPLGAEMVDCVDRANDPYSVAAVVLNTVVSRCWKILRELPTTCRCPLCDNKEFQGHSAWEDYMEHLAGTHFERRRSGEKVVRPIWREDNDLCHWLQAEGLIEPDNKGGWRVGDGQPKRNV
ncbi:hypothetical protein BT63DRAFT_449585 [Microthyrium microscopicum]|uniref:C2H2-type domain-containing protein n=1 Tax=Microthyrium microscopicum TaxID=703497 RepID=A0A6A6UUI4_9PEZI|nr:hypothetical protein BT63DRAFT_449585 [Microthyrium microscopicum]